MSRGLEIGRKSLIEALSRRSALGLLGAAGLAGAIPNCVFAQSRQPLVGVYTAMGRRSQATQEYAFLQGMRDLGYIEGQNVRYAFRYGEGNPSLYGPQALELAALGPDVIVSSQSLVLPEIQQAFAGFPVVCAAMPAN